jgi:hypothetical protein
MPYLGNAPHLYLSGPRVSRQVYHGRPIAAGERLQPKQLSGDKTVISLWTNTEDFV